MQWFPALLAGPKGGGSPLPEGGHLDASTSGVQCRHAAGVGDGTLGALAPRGALIDFPHLNGSGCTSTTDGTSLFEERAMPDVHRPVRRQRIRCVVRRNWPNGPVRESAGAVPVRERDSGRHRVLLLPLSVKAQYVRRSVPQLGRELLRASRGSIPRRVTRGRRFNGDKLHQKT